ncbi:MAG: sulfatase-like hydrolase/transferase [Bacteroidota bacterium]|nr:sulfatase-like hydrolase/transferase [Bacteroidota bacterium]
MRTYITLLLIVLTVSCNRGDYKNLPENFNIIIFLADDLGYGDLSCYGNPIIKTPNLDNFANEGVRLTDCHSGGTVCSPSRSALLTGRNPYRSGFYYIASSNTYLAAEEITIAEILKTKGYETCFLGKWHLSTLEKDRRVHPGPAEQGFDYFMGTSVNAFDGPENPGKFIRNGEEVGETEGWYCDLIVEEAADWLENIRDKTKPFFLYIASHEPHTPISPPARYSEIYNNDRVDSLEKLINYGGVKRPPEDLSEYRKEYYGTVTQLDNAFGELMETVDNLGLRDNTLVIFTSDNGPETPVTLEESKGEWDDPIRDKCFGTPGIYRGMKRYPYEGGHRVPGIVRLPGSIEPGSTSDILFNGTDILPTICSMTGIDIPNDKPLDGIANFEAFTGKIPPERTIPAVWFYPNHGDTWFRLPQMSMRSGNYSLIGWLPEKPDSLSINKWFFNSVPERFELYQLENDPGQQKDISADNPDILEEIVPVMKDLWIEMRDEGRGMKNED